MWRIDAGETLESIAPIGLRRFGRAAASSQIGWHLLAQPLEWSNICPTTGIRNWTLASGKETLMRNAPLPKTFLLCPLATATASAVWAGQDAPAVGSTPAPAVSQPVQTAAPSLDSLQALIF